MSLYQYSTHSMILISSHRHELGLREDEGLEVLRGARVFTPGVDIDHMKSWLVTMHRVEYHLEYNIEVR